MLDSPAASEVTLDPQDWDALRALGHQMVDDLLDFQRTIRERPLWREIPGAVRERYCEPLPLAGQDPAQVYTHFLEAILPYPDVNIHPRSWGWVAGVGTPVGMLADLLASGQNTTFGGFGQARTHVELQTLDWCKQMLGFPAEASGAFVTGCSMANLIGLTVARNTMARISMAHNSSAGDLRTAGLYGLGRQMVLYASEDVHNSVQKAVEVLGLGSSALRLIPVGDCFQIDIAALRRAIHADRVAGRLPFCVVGCAGTAPTGAIDDLDCLADLCREEGLWYHVDGAFGSLVALSPELRYLVKGIERADSVAFDLHKWLHMPYDVGCVLVRSREDHYRSFASMPDYLQHSDENPVTGSYWPSDYGIELSTGFRALKVWFSLKTYGVETYGRLVQQNVEQARYLATQIGRVPQLELLAPAALNVVCFRYCAPGVDEAALNRLNDQLLARLQQGGEVMVSNVTIHGKSALRAAITNHRSRREDFDLLVAEAVRVGDELLEGLRTTDANLMQA